MLYDADHNGHSGNIVSLYAANGESPRPEQRRVARVFGKLRAALLACWKPTWNGSWGYMKAQAQMCFWFAILVVLGIALLGGVVLTVTDLLTLRPVPAVEEKGVRGELRAA